MDYLRKETKKPTSEDLKLAEEALNDFDKSLQEMEFFNEPLSKSERFLLKTFFLFLSVQREEREH